MQDTVRRDMVYVSGQTLTPQDVVAVARNFNSIEVTPDGWQRARDANDAMTDIASQRPVYGQSTGVGSNKGIEVREGAATGHGLRLIQSHADGAGEQISDELARSMMVIRLNQLAAGGSGVSLDILETLTNALNNGVTPYIHKFGAVGTGDLAALSSTLLCMVGERSWLTGSLPALQLDNKDALAFISSSAATLGEAAISSVDLEQRLRASLTIATLSHLALGGSSEAYAYTVQKACPHPSQIAAASQIRQLLGPDLNRDSRRIQDPYALRALPQVHGAALDAVQHMKEVLTIEINAASENPLVSSKDESIYHNGNFHGSYVGLALDAMRAAVYGTAALSAARLSHLMDPKLTGLEPFLAFGPEGSSGLMICEYVAQGALSELRHLATPDSTNGISISHGSEEHASFSTQSAWHTTESIRPYETVLACELVAAVRALRQQGLLPNSKELLQSYSLADSTLQQNMLDRSQGSDISQATAVLKLF